MGIFGLGGKPKKKATKKAPAKKSVAKKVVAKKSVAKKAAPKKQSKSASQSAEAAAILKKMQAKADDGDCPFC